MRYTGYSDSVFSSGNPKFHDKVNAWVLYEIEDEIEANKTYTLHNYALIPAVAPSLLDGCGIISTMYQVTVSLGVFLMVMIVSNHNEEEAGWGSWGGGHVMWSLHFHSDDQRWEN